MRLSGITQLLFLIFTVILNFGAGFLVAYYGEKWRWNSKATIIVASCLF